MDKIDKKARARLYKLAFPPMGIYGIRNRVTGRQLIGKSNQVDGALNRHRLELRLGTHRQPTLMSDWRLLGEAQFTFEVLQRIQEREAPDFDYAGELDRCLAEWEAKVPRGSSGSYR